MNINLLGTMSEDYIATALKKLGLPSSKQQLNRFYPHKVSHWLGMDVHDMKTVATDIQFRPGMFITVEPGIYIPDAPDIPSYFRGIGIRIEDDVLITPGEPYVFTANAPKEVEDIEKVLNS